MDFAEIKKSLEANGAMRAAAQSAEARKLLDGIDAAALEQAAKQGDTAALKNILDQVLSTPEGQSLARQVRKAVKKDG